MTEENALMKTNRINLLFDFYEKLLTEKQQLFCKLYFHDDYSLGEIAAEFKISRQAVYEHIKRSESVLEDYEIKLQLLAKHEERQQLTQQFDSLLTGLAGEERKQAQALLGRLSNLD
ncbi:putative DNA-binding protein [Paenibacillus sp. RC67]|uniref:putative DNA-binding protein n=1 Tax=Paenibacillus sp. RC67 TaxID=3039392 RepID=UPI0024AE1BFF|nr:putative DNA-binding protein [Paenibacillus sp. RC67]